MRLARPRSALIACAVAALVAAGCGKEEEGEPKREGLGVDVARITYHVYLTRQINQHDSEDRAYWHGPEPPPGSTYYGVFVTACNEGKEPLTPVDKFKVVDNQDNEFEPLEPEEDNEFFYRPRLLTKKACVPEPGSAAANGPTGGALLVFEIPVQSIENRPLELEIEDENEDGEIEKGAIELDL